MKNNYRYGFLPSTLRFFSVVSILAAIGQGGIFVPAGVASMVCLVLLSLRPTVRVSRDEVLIRGLVSRSRRYSPGDGHLRLNKDTYGVEYYDRSGVWKTASAVDLDRHDFSLRPRAYHRMVRDLVEYGYIDTATEANLSRSEQVEINGEGSL